jgi:hypothetical protein
MMTAQEFNRIRWGLVAALAMAAIGAALVVASSQWLHAQAEAYRSASAERRDVEGKLRRARSEEAEIRQTIARFEELQTSGIVGLEQRLIWVERVRQLREALRLYDVQYEIAPQRALDLSIAPGGAPGFEFLTSSMRLQLDLLHEGDLLAFLDELKRSVPAHIRVRQCAISRAPAGAAAPAVAVKPQLRADCTIDWITISERKPNA